MSKRKNKKSKPGPKPDVVKLPLPFEEAVKAALETPLKPPSRSPKKTAADEERPSEEGRS